MSGETPHYVNPAPFDPTAGETMSAREERYYRASSLRLIWWKFRAHRLALLALIFLGTLYVTLPFVEVIAPYGLQSRHNDHIYVPVPNVLCVEAAASSRQTGVARDGETSRQQGWGE